MNNKRSLLVILIFLFTIHTVSMSAQQNNSIQNQNASIKEEDKPLMQKFEPNYLKINQERKEEIALHRKIIDTLDLSERMRTKLLKDLYKKEPTNRLKKVLFATTKFEDIDQ